MSSLRSDRSWTQDRFLGVVARPRHGRPQSHANRGDDGLHGLVCRLAANVHSTHVGTGHVPTWNPPGPEPVLTFV